ncbi:MAG: hypothetical protein HY562_05890 [Ignavibacteriales bacterium]|nr:hypothetical protein [Ignavibacteriales bacterium]
MKNAARYLHFAWLFSVCFLVDLRSQAVGETQPITKGSQHELGADSLESVPVDSKPVLIQHGYAPSGVRLWMPQHGLPDTGMQIDAKRAVALLPLVATRAQNSHLTSSSSSRAPPYLSFS